MPIYKGRRLVAVLGASTEEALQLKSLLESHLVEELVVHATVAVEALQLQNQQRRQRPESQRFDMRRLCQLALRLLRALSTEDLKLFVLDQARHALLQRYGRLALLHRQIHRLMVVHVPSKLLLEVGLKDVGIPIDTQSLFRRQVDFLLLISRDGAAQTALSPRAVSTSSAIALHRAEREGPVLGRFCKVGYQVAHRHPDRQIQLGGRTAVGQLQSHRGCEQLRLVWVVEVALHGSQASMHQVHNHLLVRNGWVRLAQAALGRASPCGRRRRSCWRLHSRFLGCGPGDFHRR
mmetsp:Transcript_26491/g.62040  ORF Transcript_26491/g.62040 Transcript_26491/m.62040 type:complete len:292 (-) Transcript_26491:71-946(-)